MLDFADLSAGVDAVIINCRFALGKPDAGREQYLAGRIPGAHYLHLEEDLPAPVGRHGGRHPLPKPEKAHARRRFSEAVKGQGKNKRQGKAQQGLAWIQVRV